MPKNRAALSKTMVDGGKPAFEGVTNAMSRSLTAGTSFNSSHSGHRNVTISEDELNYYGGTRCSVSGLWFGSYYAVGVKDRAWKFNLQYRRQDGFLKLSLISEDVQFHVVPNDIREMSICTMFEHMLFVILPTAKFAATVAHRLGLVEDKNEYFDPTYRVNAVKRMVVDFSGLPDDDPDKRAFHTALLQFLACSGIKLATLEETEALETIESQKAALNEVVLAKTAGNFTPDVISMPLPEQTKKRFFATRVIALGAYVTEEGEIELDQEKSILRVFGDKTKGKKKNGIQLSSKDIERCDFLPSARLAVFQLGPTGDSLSVKLDNPESGFRKGAKYSRTSISQSHRNLRVLFTSPVPANMDVYLESFKLMRNAKLMDNYAQTAFPEWKEFGGISDGTSLFDCRATGGARSKTLNSAKPSNSTIMTVSQAPSTKPGQSTANPIPPSKRPALSVDPKCKKPKPEEGFVDLDEDSLDSVSAVVAGPVCQNSSDAVVVKKEAQKQSNLAVKPVTKKEEMKIEDVPELRTPFYRRISIMDSWEERVRIRKAREAEEAKKAEKHGASPVKTAKPKESAVPATTSSDCIVLEDSSDDEDNTTMKERGAPGNTTYPDFELPEDCHEIFRSIHTFPEVILGNASVMAGDVYQLAKGQQLGDGIIQFMLEVLRLAMNEEDTKEIHFMSYFFFQTFLGAVRGVDLVKQGSSLPEAVFARLRDHTKKIKIFDFKYLVIPVLNDQHWYLVVICHPNPKEESTNGQQTRKPVMLTIDSLHSFGSKERHKFTGDLLARWLECEYFREFAEHFSYTDTKICKRFLAKTPQQTNGVDCGVFLFNALAFFIREKYRFVELGQSSSRPPKLAFEKWFPHDEVAIEQSRLMMLHCYYTVAAIGTHTVYRDSYIPDLIAELANKERPSAFGPEDEIVINSTPIKTGKSGRTDDGTDLSKTLTDLAEMADQTHVDETPAKSRATIETKPAGRDFSKSLVHTPRSYLRWTPFTPPENMTPEQREYYTLAGYTMPQDGVSAKTKEEQNIEKLRRFLVIRAQEKAGIVPQEVLWEPHFVPGRTAQSLYDEFTAWKGDKKKPDEVGATKTAPAKAGGEAEKMEIV